MAQTDEDRISGVLRLRFGTTEREVPTLPLRPAREWQRRVSALSGGFGLPSLADWDGLDVGRFANLTTDALLDLAVAYDRTGALGGREWLEENADPAEVYEAVVAMAENAFPFVRDGRSVLATMVAQATLASSRPESSTNGRSARGASTPGRSRKHSTESN